MQNIDDCRRNLERAFKAMKEQLVDHLLPEPRGILNKVYTGGLRPVVQRLTLLHIIFNRKGVAFWGHVTDRNDR